MRAVPVLAVLAVLVGLLAGCGGAANRSFTAGAPSVWSTIPVRKDFTYEQAWNALFERFTDDFAPEFISREDGFYRSAWTHTWSGRYQAGIRARVSVKFSPDRKQLRLRCEAERWEPNKQIWIPGVDSELMETMKTDVMGIVSTTTK